MDNYGDELNGCEKDIEERLGGVVTPSVYNENLFFLSLFN